MMIETFAEDKTIESTVNDISDCPCHNGTDRKNESEGCLFAYKRGKKPADAENCNNSEDT